MTRLSVFLLAFAFAACDTGAPTSGSASGASGAVPLASLSGKHSENVHPVSESIAVEAEGERIVLYIDGREVVLTPADAYATGLALSRIGFEGFSEKDAALVFPPLPKGGSKCYPVPEGGTAFAIGGQMLGKCPPPPPDFNVRPDFWNPLVPDGVRPVIVPRGTEWHEIPGGFIADLPR